MLRIVSFLFAVVLLYQAGSPEVRAASYSNDCKGWATILGKESKVRDSVTMHYLGCDDRTSPTHYHATVDHNRNDFCTSRARWYARNGWISHPRLIAQAVVRDLPFCTSFEDGSYSAFG